MKNVVVFTEGKGELIFLRRILFELAGYEQLSFDCLDLISDGFRHAPYRYFPAHPGIYYLLVNVGTDERVLSEMLNRQQQYVSKGYEMVGLRDMYSQAYVKRSPELNLAANKFFLQKAEGEIAATGHQGEIELFFAVMELEAWLLGMYRNLERLDQSLTADNIRNHLGFDLRMIDPETSFFHPAVDFAHVLALAGIAYDKHVSDMENIVSRITLEDIEEVIGSHRCNSFEQLVSRLRHQISEAQQS